MAQPGMCAERHEHSDAAHSCDLCLPAQVKQPDAEPSPPPGILPCSYSTDAPSQQKTLLLHAAPPQVKQPDAEPSPAPGVTEALLLQQLLRAAAGAGGAVVDPAVQLCITCEVCRRPATKECWTCRMAICDFCTRRQHWKVSNKRARESTKEDKRNNASCYAPCMLFATWSSVASARGGSSGR